MSDLQQRIDAYEVESRHVRLATLREVREMVVIRGSDLVTVSSSMAGSARYEIDRILQNIDRMIDSSLQPNIKV
jgi:hypothetical protein